MATIKAERLLLLMTKPSGGDSQWKGNKDSLNGYLDFNVDKMIIQSAFTRTPSQDIKAARLFKGFYTGPTSSILKLDPAAGAFQTSVNSYVWDPSMYEPLLMFTVNVVYASSVTRIGQATIEAGLSTITNATVTLGLVISSLNLPGTILVSTANTNIFYLMLREK